MDVPKNAVVPEESLNKPGGQGTRTPIASGQSQPSCIESLFQILCGPDETTEDIAIHLPVAEESKDATRISDGKLQAVASAALCLPEFKFDQDNKSENVYISSAKSKADASKVIQFAMYTPSGVRDFGYSVVQVHPAGTVDIYFRYRVPQLSTKSITDRLSGVYLGGVIDPPLDHRLHTSSYILMGVYRGLIWDRGQLVIKEELPKISNGDTIMLSYNYDNKTISYTHFPKSKGMEKTNFGVIFTFADVRSPKVLRPVVGFTYGNMGLEKVILEKIEYSKTTKTL